MSKAKADEGQGTLAIEIPESAMALEIQYIPWDLIFPDPDQPRVEADSELKASIAAGGIRQAITVRPRPGAIGQYQIVDGERRWRGAQEVQTRIPCVVRLDMDDDFERVRAQLITNTGKPLTPVEEARAMAALMAAKQCSITELAQHLGKPVTTVSQRLNLMQLGPWLEYIQGGFIKYTHAAEVLLRYRGCPDAVHAEVIRTLAERTKLHATRTDGSAEVETAFDSVAAFENHVEPLFKKHLYPISKKKGDPKPIFETALHDRECTCGGIDVREWDGKRRYCGNPEWWGPREKAAKKEERAKAKAAAEKSGAKSGGKGSATPEPPKEPAWQKEQRERREFADRLRAESDAIYKAFAGAIKKASTKPKGALDSWLRENIYELRVPSKEAEKLVPRGTNGDDFMRWVAFGDLHELVREEEYSLERRLSEFGKAFGVDVSGFIKKAKAAPAAAKPAKGK